MVEGAVDDKVQVLGEALPGNEVLGIGKDSLVTHHDTLRAACGACGVEHVSGASGTTVGGQLGRDSLEGFLGHVALQRGGNEAKTVEGEIGDEEVDGRRSTEGDDV